ncbi:hypothetical protein T492DRAFT_1023395 [Pavlovales sp. CCMP2436]|nr:hypothetical protein T492DRAFT_1023395 [Pavlovales sp. CCMP2436]
MMRSLVLVITLHASASSGGLASGKGAPAGLAAHAHAGLAAHAHAALARGASTRPPVVQRRRASPRMEVEEDSAFGGAQRVESVKAGVIAAVAGGLACALPALVVDGFNVAQWEFDVDTVSLACGLFGLTYRYIVRNDASEMLRQGAIGAFALSRASAAVHVSDSCIPVPLRCEPFGLYLDPSMLAQGAGAVVVGACAFGAAAAAVDYAFGKGWVSKKD